MFAHSGRAALAAACLVLCACGTPEFPGTGGRRAATGAAGISLSPAANAAQIPSPGDGDIPREDAIDAPAAPNTGRGILRGKVLFKGPVPPRQKAMVVKDGAVCGKINHLDDRLVVCATGGIEHAVVSIRGVKGGKPIAALGREFVLDQRTCAYSPHVLLVPKGENLRILNNDGVLHNIHTFSTINKPFNVAQPKVLKEIRRSFAECERIPVRCDVHGWMSSWVVVVDHPYHAVTDAEGRFEISGIPPGRYTIECWQEELGVQTAEVAIGNGDSPATHDFVYSRPEDRAKLN